jgi:hypothetical protein
MNVMNRVAIALILIIGTVSLNAKQNINAVVSSIGDISGTYRYFTSRIRLSAQAELINGSGYYNTYLETLDGLVRIKSGSLLSNINIADGLYLSNALVKDSHIFKVELDDVYIANMLINHTNIYQISYKDQLVAAYIMRDSAETDNVEAVIKDDIYAVSGKIGILGLYFNGGFMYREFSKGSLDLSRSSISVGGDYSLDIRGYKGRVSYRYITLSDYVDDGVSYEDPEFHTRSEDVLYTSLFNNESTLHFGQVTLVSDERIALFTELNYLQTQTSTYLDYELGLRAAVSEKLKIELKMTNNKTAFYSGSDRTFILSVTGRL